MFSKLVLRKALFKDITERACLANVRLFKSHPPATFKYSPEGVTDDAMRKDLINWEYANSLFFSPQRDHKNFPTLKAADATPPVRMGFLPSSWFDNLYEKTGVTGPYLFGAGLVTFLFSKEIVIMEHQFAHFYTFWLAVFVINRKYGAKITEWVNKTVDTLNDVFYYTPERVVKETIAANISGLEDVIKCEGAQKYIFDAKKENIELQLESTYRQRLAEVHQAVKKRLDYYVEVEDVQKRLEQQHMVDWITRNVLQSITPQQEKDTITKCLSDLKVLAAKQNATA